MRLLAGKAWNLRGSPKHSATSESYDAPGAANENLGERADAAGIGSSKPDEMYEQKELSISIELDEDDKHAEEKDSCNQDETKSQADSEPLLQHLSNDSIGGEDSEEDEALNIQDDNEDEDEDGEEEEEAEGEEEMDDHSDDGDSDLAPLDLVEGKEQCYSGPENPLDDETSKEDDEEGEEDREGEGETAADAQNSKSIVTKRDLILSEQEVQEMWAGKSNVLVAVRVRPMNGKEMAQSRNVVKVLDRRLVVVMTSAGKREQRDVDVLRQHRSKDKRYAFDFAFGPETETKTVYKNTTQFLIDGVVYGYNATVFAYGATGAGKTYTMLGDVAKSDGGRSRECSPGIMLLTLQDLFKRIEMFGYSARQASSAFESFHSDSRDDKANFKKSNMARRPFSATTPSGGTRQYRVTCSFLEVYNEMIRDLLTPSSEYLDLREDPVKGPTVTGLSEVEAFSAQDIMQLLQKGNSRRSTEGTAANEASSRSHAVLQVTIERQDDGIGNGAVSNVTIGKLSLIDLAGSERASVTQNRGQRLVEGANINRSLLALGNCINALREGGKGAFVPYRDSKLTRLLKDSLGGNCRTVMIAAVSPAKNQRDETLNTLKYANRAKNIKTQVERNVLNVDYHVSEYVNLIDRLKTEISTLRGRLKHPIGATLKDLNLQKPKLDSAPSGQDEARSEQKTLVRKKVEKQQMALLREQLVLNFKERMQLRRSLIEIEAQNIANNNELEMLRPTLTRWSESLERRIQKQSGSMDDDEDSRLDGENSEFDQEEGEKNDNERSQTKGKRKRLKKRLKVVTEPDTVKSARCEISQLERANMKNCQQKLDIERRLAENERASAEVRRQMETRITSEERRELMELEYRIGMLELENMELERSRMVHRSCMSHKDMLIKRLFNQLELRDTIIDEQKKLLSNNGVGSEAVECVLEAHIEELEPLHMLEALPTGAPPTPGTATPRFRKERTHKYDLGFIKNGITPSAFGLPSPANDRPMFPLERLEEELMRIEISNEYVPSPEYARRKAQISNSSNHQRGYNHRLKNGGSAGGNKADRDRRKMRRLQGNSSGMHVLLPTGHVTHKKAHPYLRHQRLGRGRVKVKSHSSQLSAEEASSRFTHGVAMRMAPMSPPRRSAREVKGPSGKMRGKKKILSKAKCTMVKQQSEYTQHRRPPTSPSLTAEKSTEKSMNTASHSSLNTDNKVSRKYRSTYHTHGHSHHRSNSPTPNQESIDKGESSRDCAHATELQLPPLANPGDGGTEVHSTRKDRDGSFNSKLEKVKGVTAPEPLQRPSSQGENRVKTASREGNRNSRPSDTPRASTPEGKVTQSYSSNTLERKQTLERLNSRLNKETLEAPLPNDVEGNTRSQSDRMLRKERKRLCRKWGELSFVLRHVIQSDEDIVSVHASAQNSLEFLHQLDRKAAELKVLRGTLSRMLLPYSENTAAATQRANTPVTGDSPLDSVMDLKTRKQMVASANQLRSLVRVKIADDADLDQAKAAIEEALAFFQKLDDFAAKVDKPKYEVLQSLGTLGSSR